MKLPRMFGLLLLVSGFTFLALASSSTLNDLAQGKAINVVETNNVVHVYTYTGVSSEETFLSTFDEGENWENMSVTSTATPVSANRAPVRQTAPSRYSRSNRNSAVPVQSEYIKAIDSCVDSGKMWNFRDDTCIDSY